MFGKLEN